MITTGYAVKENAAVVERKDPERPCAPARAAAGREDAARECNEATAVLAKHLDEQAVSDIRKALIKAGVLVVDKDGAK